MKYFRYIAAFALLSCLFQVCVGQSWFWSARSTGSDAEGIGVATDQLGNVYATGWFLGPVMVVGTDTLYSQYGSFYLVKYDPSGNVLWARCADGRSVAYSVATDLQGNAYMTGFFYSNAITIGNDSLNNAGAISTYDVLLAKYDPAGNVLWAKSFGGTGIDYADAVTTDAAGNVYVSGLFNSSSITFGKDTFSNTSGDDDLFLLKCDSDGKVLWAKTANGYMGQAPNGGLALDAAGNIFLGGGFTTPTAKFDTVTLVNHTTDGHEDIFLAKYDNSGNLKWVNSYGSNKDAGAYGVAADLSGNVFVTGRFYADSLYIGSTLLTDINTQNYAAFFLAKYDSSGKVLWVIGSSGNGDEGGYAVATNALGDVYVTSAFFANYTTIGSYALGGPQGSYDPMFMVELDPAGNFLCGTVLYSGGDDGGGLSVDPSGNVAMIEDMEGSYPVTIGPNTFTPPGAPNYGENFYVGKFTCNTNLQLLVTKTGIACNGQASGTATANTVGGYPPFTYQWNTGQTSKVITGLVAGKYIVTVTDQHNSRVVDSVTITQPPPVVVTVGPDTSVCSGNPVNLKATGATTYTWLPVTGLSDSTGASVLAIPATTTTYKVTGTNGGCSATDSVTIKVTYGGKAGNITAPKDSICTGSSVNLTLAGDTGLLQWQLSVDGVSYTNIPSADSTVYPAQPKLTSYYRVIAGTGSCADTSLTHKLVVNPLPVPVLTAADTIFCSGDSTPVCTSHAFLSYLWNTSDTTACTTINSAGGYWVTVTDANHCSAVSPHQLINVYPVPSVSITQQGDTLSSFGQAGYRWIRNNVPIDSATNSYYVAHQSGSYAVEVTDTNGCTTTSEPVEVTCINNLAEESISIYPNPTTGNWQLTVGNSLVGSTMEIFDEQGRLVFQSLMFNLQSVISLPRISPGIYYLHISNNNQSIIKKLTKL